MRNQKGMSLIEVTIAMAMMGMVGLAYMTHVQTVARNETRQKIKNTLNELTAQAHEYLKSNDVCKANAAGAFMGIPIAEPTTRGNGFYRSLKHPLSNKDIFSVGTAYENGRIAVGRVDYQLNNITNISSPGSPWDRSALLSISVQFLTCNNNGPVFGNSGQVQTRVCHPLDTKEVTKKFEKLVAFKLENQAIKVSGGVPDILCAESQDDLYQASKEYTDLKSCVTMAKTLILTSTEGTTDCGIHVKVTDRESDDFEMAGQYSWTPPKNLVPNSTIAIMIGAGGGGGGRQDDGSHHDGGHGGKAGQYVRVPILGKGYQCQIKIGKGGAGGGMDRGGKSGEATFLNCNTTNFLAIGGEGGRSDNDKNCGGDGENVISNGIFSNGGKGACPGKPSVRGHRGSGGGGAAGETGNKATGAPGGDGYVKFTYKTMDIVDPKKALDELNLTPESLINP